MTVTILVGDATLYQGDCRAVLKRLADNSIDSIVTDPPYELGFMGKGWDSTGIANNVALWSECLRVLRPGGHMLAFSGSRTYHRMTCAIEDAGFEVRDQIMWLYGSGFPKSHNLDPFSMIETEQTFDGWGTALKPAHEPICVARKPLIGTVAANVLQFGTGAINVDGCRVELNGDYKSKANGRPSQTGLDDRYDPIAANQPDTVGRWPANVIHDGSGEVLAAFPITASGSGTVKRSSGKDAGGNAGAAYGKESRAEGSPMIFYGDTGSAARFFYCAKASREDRNEGCDAFDKKPLNWSSGTKNPGSFHAEGTDKTSQNNHPTVKPTALMAYLCRLVTPLGGTVLDHFMGSGSTGKACALEGFKFIGIDKTPEYVAIAKARIEFAQRIHVQRGMFV